jgi:hypothetical protein
MAGWRGCGTLFVVFIAFMAGSERTFAQGSIVLPNIIDPKLDRPTVNLPKEGLPIVSLPAGALPDLSLLDTAKLPQNLGLPKGNPLLLVNLPGASIVVPNLPKLAAVGSGVLGVVLDQLAPVNHLFAAKTSLNLLSPVDQLINSLTAIDDGGPNGPPAINQGQSPVEPLPIQNLWMWNAITFGSGSHGGFSYKAQYGDSVTTGTTLPIRSSDRAELPGLIWDATSEAGLKSGTLHFGLIGGVAESDLDIEGDAILKGIGITDAGWANLQSWSVGSFALLTTRTWYAGSAIGGSWGSSESENFVVGTRSDYDVSCFTSALFLGTIVPITDNIRVDFRGTLGYQRTVGEAHEDSIGIDYSDHIIESSNGSLSARLFGVIRDGDVTARPYLQGGVAHRFHYRNELQIADVDFTFSDADTSAFVAGGIDFEINRVLQLSIGARQDHSEDFDALSGRVGLLITID